MTYNSTPVKIFRIFNVIILITAALLCLAPFMNLLAISLSDGTAAAAGHVGFLPVGFNLESYIYIVHNDRFTRAFMVSVIRVILGVAVNFTLVVLCAYPLSKSKEEFRSRSIYSWYFVITMLFVPSLIPMYIVVMNLGLIDSIWALILPGALPVFSMIVVLNFFRNLPKELEESAAMDGAGHGRILLTIFLPLSKPALATIILFSAVHHWNSWFDGIIFMNRSENYPLQSYLQTIVVNPAILLRDMAGDPALIAMLRMVSERTVRAAQLFVAAIPILLLYPFLQRYFITGLVLGSVKE